MNQQIKPAEKLPGSFGKPFIGEAVELFTQQECFYWHRFQRYGTAFRTQIMNMKIACLVGSQANQLVLKDQANKFSSRMGWSFLEPLLGEGLLLQDGNKHQFNRKLMYSKAFHPQALISYFSVIQNTVEQFLDSWKYQNSIFLIDELRQLTLLIFCRLLLGMQSTQNIKEFSWYFSEIIAGIRTVLRWEQPFTKFGRALAARRQLELFLRSSIEQRRKQKISPENWDILGLMLSSIDENGNKLNDTEIVTQTLQLLFAGQETTAKFLCWSLLALNAHPEWMEKLQQEQSAIVGTNFLAFSHLKQFTLMSLVIKEVERLYPPIYSIPRGVTENVEYAGYRIPKGWYVVLSPLLTHRLSKLFPEPNDFDPSRFAPPREEDKQNPFALIGFGGGSHKCLGAELAQMEIKIILSTLLRHYDWQISPLLEQKCTPVNQTAKIEKKARLTIQSTH